MCISFWFGIDKFKFKKLRTLVYCIVILFVAQTKHTSSSGKNYNANVKVTNYNLAGSNQVCTTGSSSNCKPKSELDKQVCAAVSSTAFTYNIFFVEIVWLEQLKISDWCLQFNKLYFLVQSFVTLYTLWHFIIANTITDLILT